MPFSMMVVESSTRNLPAMKSMRFFSIVAVGIWAWMTAMATSGSQEASWSRKSKMRSMLL